MDKEVQQPAVPSAPTEEFLPSANAVTWPEDRAHALYMEHLKQAWADTQSSSDQFDKSILTYSSAGLGVSLVFLKEIVPIADAVGLRLLYASWIGFAVAILVTILSFQLSIRAQRTHLDYLCKYYLERKLEYLNPRNRASEWLGYCTWASGVSFMLAIVGTIYFSVWNLSEVRRMSFPIKVNGGRMPTAITPLDRIQDIIQKGRTPVSVTPVVPAAPVAPAPAPAAPPAVAPSPAPAAKSKE